MNDRQGLLYLAEQLGFYVGAADYAAHEVRAAEDCAHGFCDVLALARPARARFSAGYRRATAEPETDDAGEEAAYDDPDDLYIRLGLAQARGAGQDEIAALHRRLARALQE